MKSKLLLALCLGGSIVVSAQKTELNNTKALSKSKSQVTQFNQGNIPARSSSREVIWTNDFSNAADWESTTQGAPNDAWVIGTTGPSGPIPIPAIVSTTASNGFAKFDSDLSCSGDQIVNLTQVDSVDCSLFPQVILQFEQFYRRFNDSTFVFVSNDNGANWVKYPVNTAYTTNTTSPNSDLVKVNISATAGNQAAVKIRFQFWSPSSYNGPGNGGPGCGYAWMIDDVELATPPDFELLVNTLYHGDIVRDWEYGIYPLSQADTTVVYAIVRNEGVQEQDVTLNYDILRNGTSVNSGSSATITIGSFVTDTIIFSTGYTPDAIGNYELAVEITSANEDEIPENNTLSSTFSVSEFIYSGVESLQSPDLVNATYSSETAPGVFEIIKSGILYNILNDVDCKAIDIAVSATSTDDTELLIELLQSDLVTSIALGDYTITSSHPTTAQYITIQLDQTVSLTGGNTVYAAAASSLANDKQFYLYLNDDGDPDNSGFVEVEGELFGVAETPCINLNLDPTIGFKDVNGVDNLTVYPNPANESIRVNFELNGASNVSVNLIDAAGKVVFFKNINGNVLKYQDTIGTAEFANGVYSLQITTANGVSSQKVVIVH
jgi:hypothetical protein